MRIALTHPFCWPYVRRGTERYLDALLRFLSSRGHDVTLISSQPAQPGPADQRAADPRVLLRALPGVPSWAAARLPPPHRFFWPCLTALAPRKWDVVHSFFFSDALAADLLKPFKGYRTIVQIHGPPVPGYFRRFLPPERPVVRRVLARADRVVVPSRYVAGILREHYGIEAEVLRCPLELEGFEPDLEPRRGPPVILSVADFAVPTKGVRVLVDAFARVLATHPDARLRLFGNAPDALRAELTARVPSTAAERIELLGLGRPEDLPQIYRQATVMALPSMRDAAPYTIFESWACGTPVVVTDHGGAPEYVAPGVGLVFDPCTDGYETHNVTGLSQALLEGIELARDPQTPRRCRAQAEQHRFERFAEQIEAMYRSA
jgi:glycosyltransferase involved in cell wall biosynthesis